MDCSIWPQLTLDELSKEQLVRLGTRRYPFAGSFELTERCNLRCVHCFINQQAGSRAARGRELPTSQVEDILDQVAGAGCLHLLLTGGEVLLRHDFARIYRHAVHHGVLLTLFTNGTLLTPRIAGLLAEWPPRLVEITIYGATQETFERVTGVPGSYARCMAGIELLLRNRVPLVLKSVVLQTNQHELKNMKAFAARLGLDFRYDADVWPRTDGGTLPLTYRLSPEEIVALDENDIERASEWRLLFQRAFETARSEMSYACGAGRYAFHIDCAGRLSPCIMARFPASDLLRDTFQRAWEEDLGAAIRAKQTMESPCRTCLAGSLCTHCPGWSHLVHGNHESLVPFVCELARLRTALFGSPTS